MNDIQKLKEYATTLGYKIIIEGTDKETLEIPILIVLNKRNFHIEILELKLDEGHIVTNVLSEVYIG